MSPQSETQTLDPQAAEMQADTATIYGNICSTKPYYRPDGLTLPNAVETAFSFSLQDVSPQQAYSFTKLEVAIGPVQPGDNPAPVEVFLREDTAGTPAQDPPLFTDTLNVPPHPGDLVVAAGATGIRLHANTPYWLCLRASPSGPTPLWYLNTPGVVGPCKVKTGDNWGLTTSQNQGAFRISGSPL
jgi:hypothetical protein